MNKSYVWRFLFFVVALLPVTLFAESSIYIKDEIKSIKGLQHPRHMAFSPKRFLAVIDDTDRISLYTPNEQGLLASSRLSQAFKDLILPQDLFFSSKDMLAIICSSEDKIKKQVVLITFDNKGNPLPLDQHKKITGFGSKIALAFSPDGNTLAITDYDNRRVTLHTLNTNGTPTSIDSRKTIRGIHHPEYVAFSADSKLLAISSKTDERVTLHTINKQGIPSGVHVLKMVSELREPSLIAFSTKNQLAILNKISGAYRISIYTIDSLGIPSEKKNNLYVSNNVNSILFSKDGTLLVTTGSEVSLFSFDHEGKPLDHKTISGIVRPVTTALSPRADLAIADADNGRISIHQIDAQGTSTPVEQQKTIFGLNNPHTMALSAKGALAIAGDYQVSLHTFDAQQIPSEIHANRLITGLNNPQSIDFSPDGNFLAIADTGNHRVTIHKVDASGTPSQNQPPMVISGPQELVTARTSATGYLATLYQDNIIHSPGEPQTGSLTLHTIDNLCRLSPVQPQKALTGLKGELRSVTFSPDGKLAAITYDRPVGGVRSIPQGTVYKGTEGVSFHRVNTLGQISPADSQKVIDGLEYIGSIAFSPDHRFVAIVAQRTVFIYPLDKNSSPSHIENPHQIPFHYGWPSSVIFSPKGSLLIGGNKKISVYSIAADGSPSEIEPDQSITGFKNDPRYLAFLPNGVLAVRDGERITFHTFDNTGVLSPITQDKILNDVGYPRAFSFSSQGILAVADDNRNRVTLHMVDSKGVPSLFDPLRTLRGLSNPHIAGFSSKGDLLTIIAGKNKELHVFKIDKQGSPFAVNEQKIKFDLAHPISVAFSPQGFLAVADSDNKRVTIHTVNKTGAASQVDLSKTITDFNRPAELVFSKKGCLAVTDEGDNRVTFHLIDTKGVPTGIDLSKMISDLPYPHALAFSPDGLYVAIASLYVHPDDKSADKIYLYSIDENGKPLLLSQRITGLEIRSLSFAPDRTSLVITGQDNYKESQPGVIKIIQIDSNGRLDPIASASIITDSTTPVAAFFLSTDLLAVLDKSQASVDVFKK